MAQKVIIYDECTLVEVIMVGSEFQPLYDSFKALRSVEHFNKHVAYPLVDCAYHDSLDGFTHKVKSYLNGVSEEATRNPSIYKNMENLLDEFSKAKPNFMMDEAGNTLDEELEKIKNFNDNDHQKRHHLNRLLRHDALVREMARFLHNDMSDRNQLGNHLDKDGCKQLVSDFGAKKVKETFGLGISQGAYDPVSRFWLMLFDCIFRIRDFAMIEMGRTDNLLTLSEHKDGGVKPPVFLPPPPAAAGPGK